MKKTIAITIIMLLLVSNLFIINVDSITLHEVTGGITDAYIVSDTNCTEYFDDDIVGRISTTNLTDDWYTIGTSYYPSIDDDLNISRSIETTVPNSMRLSDLDDIVFFNLSNPMILEWVHFDVFCQNENAFKFILQNKTGDECFMVLISNSFETTGQVEILSSDVIPQDIDMDGIISLNDLFLVSAQYGSTGPNGWIREDVNDDGEVAILDSILVSNEWGTDYNIVNFSDTNWISVNISYNWSDNTAGFVLNRTDYGWFSMNGSGLGTISNILFEGNNESSSYSYIENFTASFIDSTFFYDDRLWRDTSTLSEENIVDITTSQNHTDEDTLVLIKVPVSTSVRGIISVQNNSIASNPPAASPSSTYAGITNNTYFYDCINQFVYIGTHNLSLGYHLNWTVLCTYDLTFNVLTPKYLEVGDYFMATGHISNSTYISLEGFISETRVYNDTFVDMLDINPVWNCTGGNYQCTFSTYEIPPGVYNVSIELYYYGVLTYVISKILYISEPGSNSYSDAVVYFNFYNTNIGLGVPQETLKVYVDGYRLYNNIYYTYTSKSISIKVKDYYNSTLYYGNYTVNNTIVYLDLGLTFHSWLFGNMNEDYYMVSILKQGATRWWERGIVPYGEREFLIPSGTYAMRIYDKNSVELYNSTLPPSINVVNSRVYVIFGTNLSEIISGQSVIRGQLLELQNDLDDATRPEIVKVCHSLPLVYSTYKKEGAILGTELICPALITMAETTNQSLVHKENKTFHPNIPVSDHDNGTITVRTDTLYLSGNASAKWVNITFGGGNFTNYTYIPNHVNGNGGNISVNVSDEGYVTVKRVTEYQSLKKFYWTKYTNTLEYEATIDVENPFTNTENITRNIYVYMEFANDTTPKYNTVTFYDVTNGVYLTRGENYDTSASGIHWFLTSMNPNTTRSFRAEYTAEAGVVTPSNAVTVVNSFSSTELGGKSYWYVDADWANDQPSSFLGPLHIQFNFSLPYPIAFSTVKVYDEDNSRYLDRDEFAFSDAGVIIIQSIMGTVRPGSARNFKVYFQMTQTVNPENNEIVSEGNNPLSSNLIGGYPIGYILALILGAVGIIYTFGKKKKIDAISLLIFFFAFLLAVLT